ncbi:MAG: MarR family transcriptional regulator [Chloroflexota bacterium]|nr:MarR family transcriptional regulator [Chloroflexota bacterium]
MKQTEQTEGSNTASPAELQFVEAVALSMEQQGLVRMAGRVIGWLLICDPPEQTFNQLVTALQASKGSISTAMQFLVTAGLVERFSRPGERRDYYRVRPGTWVDLGRRLSSHYAAFTALTEQGLALLAGATVERRERLQAMHDFYVWLEREMPALWDRWERENGGALRGEERP